jgi:uncharacterized protein (DUF1697 family)
MRFSFGIFLSVSLLMSTNALAMGPKAPKDLCSQVQAQLKQGDLIFVQIGNVLFDQVAKTQNSWANHVGIAFQRDSGEWYVSESTIPRSRETELCDFVKKGEKRHVGVTRYHEPLESEDVLALQEAARERLGILYHTGFKLYSDRQFCSKYVDEVYTSALGIRVGREETFRSLMENTDHPEVVSFWRLWFTGVIPWNRVTLTPASQLHDENFDLVFEWIK